MANVARNKDGERRDELTGTGREVRNKVVPFVTSMVLLMLEIATR